MSLSVSQTTIVKRSSVMMAVLFVFLISLKVLDTGSSTGGIWFLFMPVYGYAAYLVVYSILWSGFSIWDCKNTGLSVKRNGAKDLFLPLLIIFSTIIYALYITYSIHLVGYVSNTDRTESELRRVYHSTWARYDRKVVAEIASHSSLSSGFITEIANTHRFDLDKDMTGGLRALFREDNRSIGERIASHENVPVALIERWGANSAYSMRKAIAENKKTPVSVLEEISRDKYSIVRSIVARNPNASIDLLRRLGNDSDDYVRVAVAKNSTTPVSVIEKLSTDAHTEVRRIAKARLDAGK